MAFLRRMRDALLYVAGPRRVLDAPAGGRFERIAWPMMTWGILQGLLLVGVWDVAYRLTWPRRLDWIVPSALCAAAIVAMPLGGRASALVASLLPGRRKLLWPALGVLTAAMAVLLNHAVRYWDPDWPTQLPPGWMWLWPRALYRVLLLAPAWGAWGMLAVVRFCRPGPTTDAATRRLAATVSPLAGAASLAIPLAGSFVYLLFLPPVGRFVPPAVAILAALGGGGLLCRFRGGLSRRNVLAGGFLTEAAFLTAYLAVR